MKYIKDSFNTFLNSFKVDKPFFYSAFVDLIFYIFIFAIGYFFYSSFFKKIIEFSSLNLTGIGFDQIGLVARSFILSLFSMGLVATLLSLFFYSIFKSAVWATTMKVKLSDQYRKKFSILASLWILFWIIFALLFKFFLSVKNLVVFAFLLIFLNYLTKILFISFTNSKADIKKGFEGMIDIAFKKFYMFFLPYFLEFIVFIVLFLSAFIFKSLPTNIFYVIIFLIFLLYSAWTRRYFVSVVKSLN